MKAAIYNGPGNISIGETRSPQLSTDSVILKIKACAICGTDLKLYTVGNPRCKPPIILGHELVGEVVEVGEAVEGFSVGDRVTMATSIACNRCGLCSRGLQNLCRDLKCISYDYDGAYAELMAVPPQGVRGGNLIKVPPSVSDEAAALAEPLSCVVNAQKVAGVKAGDTVAVLSAGPLGCINAEVAKAFGARRVIMTEVVPGRIELARKLKDVEVVDVTDRDAPEEVRALTNGEGVDVVMAAAPSARAQADAPLMARKGGTVNLFGSLPKGKSTIEIDTRVIHYGQISITGASDSRPCDVRDALNLLEAGKIDTDRIVTHRLPLERFIDGLELMKQRVGLKIVVTPGGSNG